LDGQPSVALSIFQLPDSNALETARGVYAKMEDLKKRFPEGLDYRIVYDTTPFIRESIYEVFNTLRDAVILVAIVVLAFLQNWRAALIPLVAVPVAIVGTFAVMAALGFSLNNLSFRAGPGDRGSWSTTPSSSSRTSSATWRPVSRPVTPHEKPWTR
jgi:multidrug efflux pump subunit AcrB